MRPTVTTLVRDPRDILPLLNMIDKLSELSELMTPYFIVHGLAMISYWPLRQYGGQSVKAVEL